MEDDLPSDFDTIVIGTGMPECILAAAHARNGKQVLHIDRNEYYGGNWATFNFDGLEHWMENINKTVSETCITDNSKNYSDFLKDGEFLISCSYNTNVFTNLECQSFVKEIDKFPKEESSKPLHETTEAEDIVSSVPHQEVSHDSELQVPETKEWCMSRIHSLYRKFNLDLAPKLLFSRGELVDLLISSNIARYAEFKSVTRVLTLLNGKLEQVPCSRADVFSTKNVSIVEKRMLMKLLSFCSHFEEEPNVYHGYENKTFVEFLKSRKLTENVQHYVLHAIAMVSENATTLEGLKATQRFLSSLGRYGNTPFLWPLYGSGELPQCFCRLCAVFGGIYYLKREVEAVIVNSENKCEGIISSGKRLNCRYLVMDANFAPQCFLPNDYGNRQLSRAILLTNRSILPADKEQLTFCRMPPTNDLHTSVWLVELGPAAMACPNDLYVVHLTSETVVNAKSDLKGAVDKLFEASESEGEQNQTEKPKVIWSIYFNQINNSVLDFQSRCPENVFLTSGPSSVPDYDEAVLEARDLFKRMFADEEFLPRAPDPEEIIIEDAAEVIPEQGFSQELEQEKLNEQISECRIDSGKQQPNIITGNTPEGDVKKTETEMLEEENVHGADCEELVDTTLQKEE